MQLEEPRNTVTRGCPLPYTVHAKIDAVHCPHVCMVCHRQLCVSATTSASCSNRRAYSAQSQLSCCGACITVHTGNDFTTIAHLHGVKHWKPKMSGTALFRSYSSHHLGPVVDGLQDSIVEQGRLLLPIWVHVKRDSNIQVHLAQLSAAMVGMTGR